MRNWPGIVVGLAVLASGSLVHATPPEQITNPDWLEQPDSLSLSSHYPKVAQALEIAGYAQINCMVNERGRLADCVATVESPRDLGFGAAALRMSGQFRMKPKTINGDPVAGGTVSVPIRFALPPIPPALPVVASGEARSAALRIVHAQGMVRSFIDALEKEMSTLEAGPILATPDTVRLAASAAYRAAIQAHTEDFRLATVNVLLATYSSEELIGIAAFADSPGGDFMRDNSLAEKLANMLPGMKSDLEQDLHAAFCELRACRPTEDERKHIAASNPAVALDAPKWVASPSAVSLRLARPVFVTDFGVEGAVRMTCTARGDGSIDTCGVEVEAPSGYGFGAAALRLAPNYALATGPTSAGQLVTVRVGFPGLVAKALQTPTPQGDPRRLALARRVIGRAAPKDAISAQAEAAIKVAVARPQQSVDPALAQARLAAVRIGFDRALGRFWASLEDQIAAGFSAEQLSSAADFLESPTGRVFMDKAALVNTALMVAARQSSGLVSADARAVFCKTQDCKIAVLNVPQANPTSPALPTLKP